MVPGPGPAAGFLFYISLSLSLYIYIYTYFVERGGTLSTKYAVRESERGREAFHTSDLLGT